MHHQQHQLSAGHADGPAIPNYQAQGSEEMASATPFAALAERCGLSQREAAEFLKVRIDTVKSWSAGRNAAKPDVLAELRGLYANIQAAAEILVREAIQLLERQLKADIKQRAIVFGVAETDDVARAFGFPSQGPYMAAIGLALMRLPDDVVIVTKPQSYPGRGDGGMAPVFPGKSLTWPPSRVSLKGASPETSA